MNGGEQDGAEEGGRGGAPSWMANPELNPFMKTVHERWDSDGGGGTAGVLTKIFECKHRAALAALLRPPGTTQQLSSGHQV